MIPDDMRVYIEGRDVTENLDIRACTYTDEGADKTDHAELNVGNKADMLRWKVRAGEHLRITAGGVDSGELLIYGAYPMSDNFIIASRAAPDAAYTQRYTAYEDATVGDIARTLAREMGLKARLFGVTAGQRLKYVQRSGDSAPAFLARVLTPQAGVVKFASGAICGISLDWALKQPVCASIDIQDPDEQIGTAMIDMTAPAAICRVTSPYGGAEVATGASGIELIETDAPVYSASQALSWASGALRRYNAVRGLFEVETEFDARIYALGRVKCSYPSERIYLAGAVQHDFCEGVTHVIMMAGGGA